MWQPRIAAEWIRSAAVTTVPGLQTFHAYRSETSSRRVDSKSFGEFTAGQAAIGCGASASSNLLFGLRPLLRHSGHLFRFQAFVVFARFCHCGEFTRDSRIWSGTLASASFPMAPNIRRNTCRTKSLGATLMSSHAAASAPTYISVCKFTPAVSIL